MSLKLNNPVHHAPFFPPGIAQHKGISALSNDCKKPQTVKECKMLSRKKINIMSTSLENSNDRRNNLRRFSNSTPNLKEFRINKQEYSIHKQTCDMGLSNYTDFKATPLPLCYSSERMERSFTNYSQSSEKIKTRSLDRLSSSNKSRNLTGFVPDKPFYPPSKYPNIHDKVDTNIQRLLETRDKYKTPESRRSTHKIARRQSMSSVRNNSKQRNTMQNGKNNLNESQKYGSVPNLQKKQKYAKLETTPPFKKQENVNTKIDSNMKPIIKTDILSKKNFQSKENETMKTNEKGKKTTNPILNKNENNEVKENSLSKKKENNKKKYDIQSGHEKEIGPYRQSNRLDLEGFDELDSNKLNEMTNSYFYPKPIPNQKMYSGNDRMAQSLIFERSVASMIYTGSLDRANRNYQNQPPLEITDVDESPTKRLNSFSQDSLDGTKCKRKQQPNVNNHSNTMFGEKNNDDISRNSEPDQSSTLSQIEEDEFKIPCTHLSGMHSNTSYLMNNYWDSLPVKDDIDQYNIDELMKPTSSIKDLSSFSQSGRNSPISINNEFISNREHSIIGKDDQTLLNDLASKCIVFTDRNHVQIIITDDNSHRLSPANDSNAEEYSIRFNDQKLLENIASKCIISVDENPGKRSMSRVEDFTEVTPLNSPYDLERNEFIIPDDSNPNMAIIRRSVSLYEENKLRKSYEIQGLNDDIPKVTLDSHFSKNSHNNDNEKSNFKRNENAWLENNASTKVSNGYLNDQVLITSSTYTNVQGRHSPNPYDSPFGDNDCNRPNWSRNIEDENETIFNEYRNHIGINENLKASSRIRNQKDDEVILDLNLCEIIMTNDNLTGIKDPHDHMIHNVLIENNNSEIIDCGCTHLTNCSYHRDGETANGIVTPIEPKQLSFIRPNSPYVDKSPQKKHESTKIHNNENVEYDKNGEQIIKTYDNLTGIKDMNNQNDYNQVYGRDETLSNDDNINMVMGTDQFCNQIFISGHNYAKFQKVLSPVDLAYCTVKDILLNDPKFNLDGGTTKSSSRPSFLDSLNAQNNDYPYNKNNMNIPIFNNRNATKPIIQIEQDRDFSESSSVNELSWSDYEENLSCRDYVDNSVAIHRNGTPWVSSPDIHSAHYNYTGNSGRHLQSENPLKPLCSVCHMPAYFMERISISNIIFHKSCFRCRKCETHLNFNNCIIYRNRPYCSVHMRSKVRRSVRSASTKKLDQIKERLDNKSNIQKQTTTEVKQQKRIFYEGINSAKTKFLDDATKVKEIPLREPKRITPPREGFNSGVIESEPKPRDPNIIAYADNQTSYMDEMNLLTQNSSTKENRARLKELQDKSNGSKDVFDENESVSNRKPDVIPVDTRSLRNKFTVGANDSNVKVKKINPSDEIRRLSEQETNSIYENEPESKTDKIKANSPKDDETVSPMSRTRAKEMKERFTSFAQNDKPKKSEVVLEYGEGGVYESNPQEKLDDVVKYNYDTTVYLPENTVKSGLQRIKELQDEKSQVYQKTNKEPIKIETDNTQSGIYENTPEQSRADSLSYQNNASLLEFREKNYTNDAKKILFEKQKQEDEGSSKRSPPHMIDIWKDLCPDSGIFENEPKEQRQDVVKHDDYKYELVVQNDNPNVNGEEVSSKEKNEENNIQENN